jgi:hypothetical protein
LSTSGTYDYAPSQGEVVISAFARIGVQPSAITGQHMRHARNEANFLQSEWANRGPNLWAVELSVENVAQGQIFFTPPRNTVMILDAYVSDPITIGEFDPDDYSPDFDVDVSPANRRDLALVPIGRTEYSDIVRKTQGGRPTQYWYDRLVAQRVYLWPVPNKAYAVSYYRFRQLQDASFASGATPEVPYLMLDALVAGMAYRLSRIYARELEAQRKMDYAEAWGIASRQNTENAPLHITPDLSSYFEA